jgi:Txe/YoeB family toxin of Txe-Axe toxin-antitoxin module
MIKASKVVFVSDDLEDVFNKLDSDDFLKKAIIKAIRDLKVNAFCGVQIPKRLIPKDYKKYFINNLWKYDLPKGWRLIYTVTPENEVEIITAILDWFSHKVYEKKFKY